MRKCFLKREGKIKKRADVFPKTSARLICIYCLNDNYLSMVTKVTSPALIKSS